MNWQHDSTHLVANLVLAGTLLGVIAHLITHSNVAIPVGALGGLLVAFLVGAVRGEQL
jgi:hypothetical protein